MKTLILLILSFFGYHTEVPVTPIIVPSTPIVATSTPVVTLIKPKPVVKPVTPQVTISIPQTVAVATSTEATKTLEVIANEEAQKQAAENDALIRANETAAAANVGTPTIEETNASIQIKKLQADIVNLNAQIDVIKKQDQSVHINFVNGVDPQITNLQTQIKGIEVLISEYQNGKLQ